jgi:CheY-like chemotaxis protein
VNGHRLATSLFTKGGVGGERATKNCSKERSPNTPVVWMTGADRETVREEAERGSVDSVLFKPFLLNDFQRTVQGALASREGEQGGVGVG